MIWFVEMKDDKLFEVEELMSGMKEITESYIDDDGDGEVCGIRRIFRIQDDEEVDLGLEEIEKLEIELSEWEKIIKDEISDSVDMFKEHNTWWGLR